MNKEIIKYIILVSILLIFIIIICCFCINKESLINVFNSNNMYKNSNDLIKLNKNLHDTNDQNDEKITPKCSYNQNLSVPIKQYPKIILEEAYSFPIYEIVSQMNLPYRMENELLTDIINQRIKMMDKYNIKISVISFTSPGLEDLQENWKQNIKNSGINIEPFNEIGLSKYINNKIYEIINKNNLSHRLKVFACLPMMYPEEAAKELNRCITQLNFVGALVNNVTNINKKNKTYIQQYISPNYKVLWNEFEKLDVPLYIHPSEFSTNINFIKPETPNSEAEDIENIIDQLIDGSTFGFGVGVAEEILTLLINGTFEDHPKLKVILGHMGEIMPWIIDRIEHRLCIFQSYSKSIESNSNISTKFKKTYKEVLNKIPKKPLTYYVKNNIYFTTSGFFSTKHVKFIDSNKLMFSIDYPYENPKLACYWIDNAEIPIVDKEKITHLNAMKLLKLKI